MKIGILTLFHGSVNWGGVLQGYALKTMLESTFPGVQADILPYRSSANVVYSSPLQQAAQYSPAGLLKKAAEKQRQVSTRRRMQSLLAKRRELFSRFREAVAPTTFVYTDATMREWEAEYDCLICGSDQIWNPNVAKPGYFLAGLGRGCRKVAYAASIARDSLSPTEQAAMLPLIREFDFVSVRESSAAAFLREYLGGSFPIHEVLDPALMLSAPQWEGLIGPPKEPAEPYALAFFFSDSLAYRRQIDAYCQTKGLRLRYIPFAQNQYRKTDEHGPGDPLYDVGPLEFLRLFQNATCVFTDSFHGTVFSLLFGKPFGVYERDKKGKTSKNSRLYDLLAKFDLSDRLMGTSTPADVLGRAIDYAAVNRRLAAYRQDSLTFLATALQGITPTPPATRVDRLPAHACTGCGLCLQQCPTHCITITADTEGFPYPTVAEEACIACGKCVSTCITQREAPRTCSTDTYIGYSQNPDIRNLCSSGGLFGELATAILQEGGRVYGAAFDSDFTLAHTPVENTAVLPCLFGSKYLQSRTDGIYAALEQDLTAGRSVLFAGTPCQVAAVTAFAAQKGLSDSLYTVDFLCHGVPSPAVWESYLHHLGGKARPVAVNFRDKRHRGWHDFCLQVDFEEGRRYIRSHETDPYMRTFLSNRNLRPSCYRCRFKGVHYAADITMGDGWQVEQVRPDWADDKGISLLVVRTEKGRALMERLSAFALSPSDYGQWCRLNKAMAASVAQPGGRDEFFAAFHCKDPTAFWRDAGKMPLKKRLRYAGKRAVKCLGIAPLLRRFR